MTSDGGPPVGSESLDRYCPGEKAAPIEQTEKIYMCVCVRLSSRVDKGIRRMFVLRPKEQKHQCVFLRAFSLKQIASCRDEM